MSATDRSSAYLESNLTRRDSRYRSTWWFFTTATTAAAILLWRSFSLFPQGASPALLWAAGLGFWLYWAILERVLLGVRARLSPFHWSGASAVLEEVRGRLLKLRKPGALQPLRELPRLAATVGVAGIVMVSAAPSDEEVFRIMGLFGAGATFLALFLRGFVTSRPWGKVAKSRTSFHELESMVSGMGMITIFVFLLARVPYLPSSPMTLFGAMILCALGIAIGLSALFLFAIATGDRSVELIEQLLSETNRGEVNATQIDRALLAIDLLQTEEIPFNGHLRDLLTVLSDPAAPLPRHPGPSAEGAQREELSANNEPAPG